MIDDTRKILLRGIFILQLNKDCCQLVVGLDLDFSTLGIAQIPNVLLENEEIIFRARKLEAQNNKLKKLPNVSILER